MLTYSNIATESVVVVATVVEFDTSGLWRGTTTQILNQTILGQTTGIDNTLAISEIQGDGGVGRTFTYQDVFPTRYVFPEFSAGGTGNLMEEIHLHPNRIQFN